jgi:hypothetical protein
MTSCIGMGVEGEFGDLKPTGCERKLALKQ